MIRSLIPVFLAWYYFAAGLFGQTPAPSPALPPTPAPETGFLSATTYTNAFFGFALPLPDDADPSPMPRALRASIFGHFLIGLGATGTQVAVLTVTAAESPLGSKDGARNAVYGPHLKMKELQIAGKDFWRSESKQESPKDTKKIVYATSLNGYVLQFRIISSSQQATEKLEKSIAGLTFFDPRKAQELAGLGSRPYDPGASAVPAINRIAGLSDGVISGNTYSNAELGFRYEFPSGWVLNDQATHHDTCTKTLLFVSRYEKGTTQTERINPLVILMAVDPVCAPGIAFPKTVNDHEAIQRVASYSTRYFQQESFQLTGAPHVRALNAAGRVVLEVSQSLSVTVPESKEPVIAPSSVILMQANDYWIIWVFASNSQAELDELRKTKIFFDVPSVTHK
jgi:hypothetical protein